MTAEESRERFLTAPRPLRFVRIRVHRDGPAEWLQELLEDEQATLMDDLGEARKKGLEETSTEIVDLRNKLNYLIGIKRDLEMGLIELAGPIHDNSD